MATARSGRYMPYLGDKFANSNLIASPHFLPNRSISCYTQQKKPPPLKAEGNLGRIYLVGAGVAAAGAFSTFSALAGLTGATGFGAKVGFTGLTGSAIAASAA